MSIGENAVLWPGVVTSLEVLSDSHAFTHRELLPFSLSGTVVKVAHCLTWGITQKSLGGKSVD